MHFICAGVSSAVILVSWSNSEQSLNLSSAHSCKLMQKNDRLAAKHPHELAKLLKNQFVRLSITWPLLQSETTVL